MFLLERCGLQQVKGELAVADEERLTYGVLKRVKDDVQVKFGSKDLGC